MALEQIVEELGLLSALRDAVNFYLSYLQECIGERETTIAELADAATQVEQMNKQKEQAEQELNAMRETQGQIDKEFETIAPYVQILTKMGTIKDDIAERRQKLLDREESLLTRTKIAKSTPDDVVVQERIKRDWAIFRGERTIEDRTLQKLAEDLSWHAQRLSESNVNAKEIEKQADAIRGRLHRITETMDGKVHDITNMDNFVQTHQGQVDRLEVLKKDLSKYEVDLANITEVARLVSEVPVNDHPVPAEHTG